MKKTIGQLLGIGHLFNGGSGATRHTLTLPLRGYYSPPGPKCKPKVNSAGSKLVRKSDRGQVGLRHITR